MEPFFEDELDADDPVGVLLDEYIRARAGGRRVDTDELRARAGDDADTLTAEIRIHERLTTLGARMRAELDASPGERWPRFLGRYEVEAALDGRPCPQVWSAWDPELERRVVVKQVDPEETDEAKRLGALEHECVVDVHTVEAEGKRLVTRYLGGPDLAHVLAAMRRPEAPPSARDKAEASPADVAQWLDSREARLECLVRIAEGLDYLHGRRIVHRDVKPANVVFRSGEEPLPCLVDLGIAARIGDGEPRKSELIGTRNYLAPEQIRAGEAGNDPRSDQFAFGIVAHELLTLRHPYPEPHDGRTPLPRVSSVSGLVPGPGVDRDLEAILLKCLSIEPEARYGSMAEVVADLRSFLAERSVTVRPRAPLLRLRDVVRDHPRASWAAACVVLLAVVAIGLHGWSLRRFRADLGAARAAPVQALGAFREQAMRLGQLRARGETLDAKPLVGWLHGELTDELDGEVRQLYLEAASAFLQESRSAARKRAPFDAFESWRSEFLALREAYPGLVPEHESIARGSLEFGLPPGLEPRLYRRTTCAELSDLEDPPLGLTGMTAFRPIEPNPRPGPGLYRLVLWEPDGLTVRHEVEVFVSSRTGPPRFIPLSTLAPEWYDRSLVVPGHSVPVYHPLESHKIATRSVPGYRIGPLVTVADYAEYLRATGQGSDGSEASPDSPKVVPWQEALEYAQWAGARLPTARELVEAELLYQRTHPDFPPLMDESLCAGEWVTDLPHTEPDGLVELGCYLSYSRWREKQHLLPVSWLERAHPTRGVQWFVDEAGRRAQGFRLVRTEDTPDALRDTLELER
ncbi:MAG: serine/threonine-protein kinase [Planctomycetota bacterium]